MKKTIIITSIIFVVSAILTVCLAVALGANGLSKLMFDESALQRLEGIGERLENIGDDIEDNFENDVDDPANLVAGEHSEAAASKETAVIGCDAAEITVIPSADGKLTADLKVYSYNKDNKDDYHIENGREGYDIYIAKAVKTSKSVAKVVVYVPDTVKALKIDASAAEVTIKNLTFDSIDVSVDAGEVDIENTTVKNCNVNIDAGTAKLEKNCNVKESLTVKVDTGEIGYELPMSSNAVINYNIEVGSAEIEDGLHGYKAFDKNGNSVTVLPRTGKLESESGTEGALNVKLDVNTGSIEFEQVFE